MDSTSFSVAQKAGAGTVKVSLTEFVDFVTRTGSQKVTVVREAKRRHATEYDPRTDFYKPFREGVAGMHLNGRPKQALDSLLSGLRDAKKQTAYPELVRGYKKFLGRKVVVPFAPPRADWTHAGLSVRVNPELGLELDGVRFVIKMYLKDEKLTRPKVGVVTYLMEEVLEPVGGPAKFGVLLVRMGRLYESTPHELGLSALLEGEAATFAQIYHEI